ncbi:hypothetical protein LOTGIDRAFT_186104 [Lottia gigantea]|uniref:Mediator of RNA polymerase II transcription subunit 8 n=1 Tax=Lottia gigantea TaxID=225164 RepID=V4AB96_LOTGI|nr:hypothetical protein LOTGIDRAFT_186104 [Lottia gigantea]ESP01274.1 hypothetical protein LOTGIDRAFT_186104 [Lottia gigantea]
MQKEEKLLETSLPDIIAKVAEIKNAIASFLFKLENEYATLNWPSMLDNFALISSNMNSLSKVLKGERIPPLRNFTLFPVLLSPERDQELEKLTEGRLFMCNHEVVPDYLRTKPETDVEEKINQLNTKAGTIPSDNAQKQLNNLNKITSNILDIINSYKEEWDNESKQKTQQPQTSSQAETNTLIAAISMGKGLRLQSQISQQQMQQQMPNMQPGQKPMSVGKVPSTVKTTIRAGSHPYQRS